MRTSSTLKQAKHGLAWMLAAAATALAVPVAAQTVFRIVGPDGRVTFSDKPPATPENKAAVVTPGGRGQDSAGAGNLPFELRQVASRYPVTLYSSPSCSPCASGRTMLNGRGIPFTEKTVTSNDDITALQRIAGESSLPLLTVGPQKLKGYSETDWGQTLDLAGYPSSSKLPANFRNPAPAPLVNVERPDNAAQQQQAAAPQAPIPAPTQPEDTNPAGIRF